MLQLAYNVYQCSCTQALFGLNIRRVQKIFVCHNFFLKTSLPRIVRAVFTTNGRTVVQRWVRVMLPCLLEPLISLIGKAVWTSISCYSCDW